MTGDRAALVAAAGDTIKRGSKSFHMASRLFDRTTRERAWLLYSWCRHCDDQCDGQLLGHAGGSGGPEAVEAIKAQTLRTLSGDPPEVLPFQALHAVLSECPIPLQLILEHVHGFELDAAEWRPQDQGDLLRYCYHVAGVVGRMMAIVMGVDPEDEDTLASASDLGIAFQLANIARDVRDDHQAGRCYLPVRMMEQHGLDPADPLRRDQRDRLVALVERLTDLSKRYEASARAGVPKLPFRARWAVLASARIYGAIGRRVASLGPDAWESRVVIRKREKLAFLLPSLLESARTRPELR